MPVLNDILNGKKVSRLLAILAFQKNRKTLQSKQEQLKHNHVEATGKRGLYDLLEKSSPEALLNSLWLIVPKSVSEEFKNIIICAGKM